MSKGINSFDLRCILVSGQAKNSNDKDVCYFADLPGYGYAKMSKDKQRTIEVSAPPQCLTTRQLSLVPLRKNDAPLFPDVPRRVFACLFQGAPSDRMYVLSFVTSRRYEESDCVPC